MYYVYNLGKYKIIYFPDILSNILGMICITSDWLPFPLPNQSTPPYFFFHFFPSYHLYLPFLSQAAAPMVPWYSLVSVATPGYVLTSEDL